MLATRKPRLLFRFDVCSARPRTDGGRASPVAVGRAEVLWIVVPGTAADDPARGGDAGTMAACTQLCRREQAEDSEAVTIITTDSAMRRLAGLKNREPAPRGDEEEKLIRDQFPEERCAADAASP